MVIPFWGNTERASTKTEISENKTKTIFHLIL
jgi:hypothetical protein